MQMGPASVVIGKEESSAPCADADKHLWVLLAAKEAQALGTLS